MSGFRINTNVPALFSQRNLAITNSALSKNLERLSSGFRVNRAADDAAGLAVSERFRTQTNGLGQAQKNIQDGISLIQVAEGGIDTISDMLQRIRTLSVQASNDTLTTLDRSLIQLEVNQVLEEIDRQVSTVSFNTKVLLNGTFSRTAGATGRTSLVIQVGANKTQTIALFISTVSAKGLGINGLSQAGNTATSLLGKSAGTTLQKAGVMTHLAAESAITVISSAIDKVNSLRAELGAKQNRLERTLNFARIQLENQAASESRIRDLDFADEIVNFTKNQILQQAGTAALAQANVAPQTVLQLLR